MRQKGFALLLLPLLVGVIVLVLGGAYFLSKISVQQQITAPSQSPNSVITHNDTLVIAENTDEDGVEADTKEFQPFIDYLVSKLGSQGITKGKFVSTKSVSEMAAQVKFGKIDMVVDSAFPIYVVDKLTGAKPLVDRWKGGVETYHTIIYVKQSSVIKTLDDLKGKMISFDSPTSTVGYFLPKAFLLKKGYKLTEKNSPTDAVSSDEIGYYFAHGKVFQNVESGITVAGAESELEAKAYYGNKISDYRFLITTPDVPRFLVAVRADMDQNLKDAIKDVLLTMDQSSEGKNVLDSFAQTAKFTPIDATDTTYGVVKDLSDVVEDEIVRQ